MSAITPLAGVCYLESGIPDADLKVQLNADVVNQLNAAVVEGFKLVPRRGLEVGGLLLGRVEHGCVIVEDFEAVDSEHRRGPSWLLSDNDRKLLAEAVARANAADRVTRVVGLYRSQTRAGFAPAEEDVALMSEHCVDARRVFLLVKPDAIGSSTAMFRAGDGLRASSEVFPFRARPAAAQARPPRVLAPPPVPKLQTARVLEGFEAGAPAAGSGMRQKLPAQPHAARRLVARAALIAGMILCGGAGGYELAKLWTKAPPPRPEPQSSTPIALHATWNGSSLDLDWDRNAPQIRQAKSAVLWIDDGTKHRRLALGSDELLQGSILYWPQSSDVAFHLELFTTEATASATARVLGMPVPERAPASPMRRRGSASRAASR
jgi:hypothetical protein